MLRTNTPRLIFTSTGQNVDEARPSIRADEIADAVQQQNHSEEKQQGDPGPIAALGALMTRLMTK